MYFSSRSEGGQYPPPRYLLQNNPKNYNRSHYPFSVHGGSNNFTSHNYNASLSRGPPTTMGKNYDNPNYMPLSAPRRSFGGKCNNPGSIPDTNIDPLPTTGHYCHLSYYGKEVDKEYLPDHHHHYHSIPSNECTSNVEQLNESTNLVASLGRSTHGNTGSVLFKRNSGQSFNDDCEKYTFNHVQQQETEKFSKILLLNSFRTSPHILIIAHLKCLS